MTSRDHVLAEAVLKHLFEGAMIAGLQFAYFQRRLILNHFETKHPVDAISFYVDIESHAQLFATRPASFSADTSELGELTPEHFCEIVGKLHDVRVSTVELGSPSPDLILTFESGQVLFIHGHHEQFESWQAGVNGGDLDKAWLVVACPEDEIAIWAPSEFTRPQLQS